MTRDGRITVVGYDGGPLPEGALDGAALVMGGRRHLREVALPEGVRTIALRDDPAAAIAAVADEPGDVVVLASGDPGFYGVVRAVRRAVQPRPVRVLPAVSSVALAFGRAGVEWDDAVVVSAHGRDPREALAAARAHDKVAVLTDAECTPARIGAELRGRADRVLLVGERLGLPGERVVEVTPEQAAAQEWEQPNVVLVLDRARHVVPPAPRTTVTGFRTPEQWALPEDRFASRGGMITKPEVRAHVLARLGPRLGAVVWDLGAGSGSVAVECARFGADAHAVERDPEACELVRDNAAAHGVSVRVVHGDAAADHGLPAPDAVFVGGGGLPVVEAAVRARPSRLVVALATLEQVAPVRDALRDWAPEVVLLQASRLSPLGEGTRLAPQNPVFVVSGARPPMEQAP